jgi:hypothetical protein
MEGADFFGFLNSATAFNVGLPPMLTDKKQVTGKPVGRFGYEAELKGWKGSRIAIDVGSAVQATATEDVIRMVTIVRTTPPGVPELKNRATFPKQVAKWLDFAHGVTSPLFREIVSDDVMRKFKEL